MWNLKYGTNEPYKIEMTYRHKQTFDNQREGGAEEQIGKLGQIRSHYCI